MANEKELPEGVTFDGTKYRINRDGVHLSSPLSDYTLCGDTDDGDTGEDLDIEPLSGTQQRIVTCPRCARIILHCRDVKTPAQRGEGE